jgi:hypothetical protein
MQLIITTFAFMICFVNVLFAQELDSLPKPTIVQDFKINQDSLEYILSVANKKSPEGSRLTIKYKGNIEAECKYSRVRLRCEEMGAIAQGAMENVLLNDTVNYFGEQYIFNKFQIEWSNPILSKKRNDLNQIKIILDKDSIVYSLRITSLKSTTGSRLSIHHKKEKIASCQFFKEFLKCTAYEDIDTTGLTTIMRMDTTEYFSKDYIFNKFEIKWMPKFSLSTTGDKPKMRLFLGHELGRISGISLGLNVTHLSYTFGIKGGAQNEPEKLFFQKCYFNCDAKNFSIPETNNWFELYVGKNIVYTAKQENHFKFLVGLGVGINSRTEQGTQNGVYAYQQEVEYDISYLFGSEKYSKTNYAPTYNKQESFSPFLSPQLEVNYEYQALSLGVFSRYSIDGHHNDLTIGATIGFVFDIQP